MTLSIVIVSWNTQDLLRLCLSSIYEHPPEGKFEIIVVDNGSHDNSVHTVKELFKDVTLIHNAENLGFARATNQGICACSGTNILLLNPDTELRKDALTFLERVLGDGHRTGAVGPRLLNSDGTLQPSCFPTPTLFREIWRLFHLDKLYPMATYPFASWDLQNPREVEILNGACIIIKRDAFEEVGLLDESYFMYSEEVDLCYRLGQGNWKLLWVPQAEVIHFGGQSTRQNQSEMFQQLYRSKVLYFRKNHGCLAAKLYKAILITASLVRLIFTPFSLFKQTPKRQELIELANNYRNLIPTILRM